MITLLSAVAGCYLFMVALAIVLIAIENAIIFKRGPFLFRVEYEDAFLWPRNFDTCFFAPIATFNRGW